ncbi:SusF/SusE family outer membrane protein [Chryseobacterium sp. PBS4-4]|uniref:SusF/SusE family outer membrane protein n=1 Tax=Chryseobacterium edaphi TaxID=2976532 RepID=A0ABT2W506_9FLAO|nr:SusF/SusE family outer membrane protein [Chryseobacterium edaphi]MCU7617063.1 SusF/SusE family outer membrane protein [Chryseobacterium edaphi]
MNWGIIGNATSEGWGGKDIIMSVNPENSCIYYLKKVKLSKGDFRFRMNNDWGNSIGLNLDGSLVYDGYNLKISEDGLYDVVLDISIKSKPKYSVEKLD